MTSDRKKILVIEDERDVVALMKEDLTERGYDVRVAYDGREGLMEILENPPDVVLADVDMPVISGFELLKILAARPPQLTGVPFIFVTGRTSRKEELIGRNLGADDYITKPIDFQLLAEVIGARMARVARIKKWSSGMKQMSFTANELNALTLAAKGKNSHEIAEMLGICKRTVDFHLDNIRTKLGAVNRIDAAVKAVKAKLIEP